jgi:putative membrane protein
MDAEPESGVSAADPRIYFAAERTLLAWVRTGVAMMGFGFVVARFGLFLYEISMARGAAIPPRQGVSLGVGVTLVIVGAAVNVWAAVRHWHVVRRLEEGRPLRFNPVSFGVVVATLLAVLGFLLALYLVSRQSD